MPKLYGSVNGQTEEVTKLYGSVVGPVITGAAIDPTATHITVADLDAFKVGIPTQFPLTRNSGTDDLTKIRLYSPGNGTNIVVYPYYNKWYNGVIKTVAEVEAWGITISDPSSEWEETINITLGTAPATKEIKKLYGSVNGLTKLVYSNS